MGSFDNWAHREIKKSQARAKRAAAAKKKADKAEEDKNKKNGNLSSDQFTNEVKPTVEPEQPEEPKTDIHGGDLPEEVENDNGRGTKMEYPLLPCTTEGCKAKFFSTSNRDAHIAERH